MAERISVRNGKGYMYDSSADDAESQAWTMEHIIKEHYPTNGVPESLVTRLQHLHVTARAVTLAYKDVVTEFNRLEGHKD